MRGWRVDVYSDLFMPPVLTEFEELEARYPMRLARDPYDEFAEDYDLIWVQHGVLPPSTIRRLAEGGMRTAVVWNHMSPFVHEELPVLADLETEIADLSAGHSPQLLEVLEEFGLERDRLLLWPNPAPRCFEEGEPPALSPELTRLLVVSNHPPAELLAAAETLRGDGVDVVALGEVTGARRITPEIVRGVDAVVTIGKTVQYALALGVPVFNYDHFGGPGWLTPENHDREARYNFSGRGTRRQVTAEELRREMTDGYARARADVERLRALARRHYSLRRALDDLLRRKAIRRPGRKKLRAPRAAQWEAFGELQRGQYRTLEYLQDELARRTEQSSS